MIDYFDVSVKLYLFVECWESGIDLIHDTRHLTNEGFMGLRKYRVVSKECKKLIKAVNKRNRSRVCLFPQMKNHVTSHPISPLALPEVAGIVGKVFCLNLRDPPHSQCPMVANVSLFFICYQATRIVLVEPVEQEKPVLLSRF